MYNTLWQSVLGEIELSVSEANFQTWFKDTELISYDENETVIAVKNIFAKKQFEARFNEQVKNILDKNGIFSKSVTYIVKTNNNKLHISRETTLVETMPAKNISRRETPISQTNLNPRYTFENFIVGSSNDLAYTASQAVAANPGTKYNPLYIYGGVGLGKTHLVQAVGNEIAQKNHNMVITYISSETFVNEFLDYIRFKKKGFSDKYRSVDVLIIDDMQFIAGKEKTQEEFFHTFNHLHQNNKQIIICSDKPPKSIPTLTERLRSRFEMGMMVDIQMPDFETRCAILVAKAALSNATLSRETVEYLANNIKTNVRELEGALNQLLAYSEMRGVEPTANIAEGLIGNVRRSRPQHLTSRQIIEKTARHFQIKVDEICGSKRDRYIVVPRQVAMYLLRSELHYSFPKIAHELGRQDHTTAIHSIEKIEKSMKLDYVIREHVAAIKENLYVQ
jgi:chromosomal replication initiator protein